MLLHCEREGGASDEAALAAGWLRADTLDSLIELNELSLALLVEQSAARTGPPGGLLQQLAELWKAIDAAARRRAAACPYLLLDAGFADPLRWRSPATPPQVGDASAERYACYFTVPAAAEAARLVFIYAWHLARTQTPAARLLLGMAAPSRTRLPARCCCGSSSRSRRSWSPGWRPRGSSPAPPRAPRRATTARSRAPRSPPAGATNG